jgi:hypothetical protein
MKLYKLRITSCIHCPNKVKFKSEKEYRCSAITHRKGNFRLINVDDILINIPSWCPLENID